MDGAAGRPQEEEVLRLQEQVRRLSDQVSCLQAENQHLDEQVLKLMGMVDHHLAENQQLKQQLCHQEGVNSSLQVEVLRVKQQDQDYILAKNLWLNEEVVPVLVGVTTHFFIENQEMKQRGHSQEGGMSHLPLDFLREAEQDHHQDEMSRLSAENQRLHEQVHMLVEMVKCHLAENQKLKHQCHHHHHHHHYHREQPGSPVNPEVQPRNSPGATIDQLVAKMKSFPMPSVEMATRFPGKDYHIQFQTTGKTEGVEKTFLKDISKLISRPGVSLKMKAFTETSKDLLLVFCPIASRVGTDIENALKRFSGQQKVLLVVMHFLPKDNTGAFVDTRRQRSHPAVVQTVHIRYSLQDGFYPCEMNKAAVADAAAAIKDHA